MPLVSYRLVVKQVSFAVVAMATPVTRPLMWPTVVKFLVHHLQPCGVGLHTTKHTYATCHTVFSARSTILFLLLA